MLNSQEKPTILPRPLDPHFIRNAQELSALSGDQVYQLIISLQEEILELRREEAASTKASNHVEEAYRYRSAEVNILKKALLVLIGNRQERDELLQALHPEVDELYWLIEDPHIEVPYPTLPEQA